MADVHFELVTPERKILSETAYMVVVPGSEGDFGVLAGHAPLMSTVRDGEVAIYAAPGQVRQRIRVRGGFAEVNDKGLTLLAEHAETVG